MIKRKPYTEIIFKDSKDFRPNLTPREIFSLGSFGGTYWRPIYSSITKKKYKNLYLNYPDSWWKDIPTNHLTSKIYDTEVNKYNKQVGSSLEEWEKPRPNPWITKYNPYGWIHWYCDYYNGKRTPDDKRQIKRWLALAGPKGRFKKRLINMIKDKRNTGIETGCDDYTVSPAIRQTLQHWAYQLTENDCK
jgi:hypothetical protein